MSIEKLKKEVQNGKAVYGFNKTMKNLKLGKSKLIFLARNCPREFKEKLHMYPVEIIELKEDNEEVALVCKRPHSISIVSF